MEDGKIGIYIHIPFCVKKCIYCDFLSFAGSDLQFYDYIRALCSEIRLWGERLKYSGKAVDTVFVGGGTLPRFQKDILPRFSQSFGIVLI